MKASSSVLTCGGMAAPGRKPTVLVSWLLMSFQSGPSHCHSGFQVLVIAALTNVV